MRKKLVPEIITLMLAVLCVLTVVLVHRGVDYDRYASVKYCSFRRARNVPPGFFR